MSFCYNLFLDSGYKIEIVSIHYHIPQLYYKTGLNIFMRTKVNRGLKNVACKTLWPVLKKITV
jgi:hypothetical protein